MSNNDVPIWENDTLTIGGSVEIFRIEKTNCVGWPRKPIRWLGDFERQPHPDQTAKFGKIIDSLDTI